MAVFDWVMTAVVALIVAKLFGKNFLGIFVILTLCAILVHWTLGVPTRLNACLGLAKMADVDAARKAASD